MGFNMQGGFESPRGGDQIILATPDRTPSLDSVEEFPRFGQMALGVNSARRLPPPSPFSIEHDNLFNSGNKVS